jgi:hypothetical protein
MVGDIFEPHLVVELAAGYGRNKSTVVEWLGERPVPRYVGIDISPHNRDRAISHRGFPERDFVAANLLGWEYKDANGDTINNVDLAIVWNTLCYFDEGECFHILTSLHEQLGPNAKVLVSEPKGARIREIDQCAYRPFNFYHGVFKIAGFVVAKYVDHEQEDVQNDRNGGELEATRGRSWLLVKEACELEFEFESVPEKFQKSNTGALLVSR